VTDNDTEGQVEEVEVEDTQIDQQRNWVKRNIRGVVKGFVFLSIVTLSIVITFIVTNNHDNKSEDDLYTKLQLAFVQQYGSEVTLLRIDEVTDIHLFTRDFSNENGDFRAVAMYLNGDLFEGGGLFVDVFMTQIVNSGTQ